VPILFRFLHSPSILLFQPGEITNGAAQLNGLNFHDAAEDLKVIRAFGRAAREGESSFAEGGSGAALTDYP
jgi:hypothetical protein